MRIIYEPRGRAREYAPLAVSLYRGCSHGCTYCFGPDLTRMKREDWNKYPRVRGTYHLMEKFEKDCAELAAAGDQREILMSFTTDPYQPLEMETRITRAAIEILIRYGLHFTVLTKGGQRSTRDFDLMAAHPDLCRYGTTLVFDNINDKERWEPGAAHTPTRISSLQEAKRQRIRTWVSFEPVIFPDQTLNLIRQCVGFVDEFKIGKFNHIDSPDAVHVIEETGYQYPTEDQWREFVQRAEALLRHHHCQYVFKKDLQPYLREKGE